MNHFFTNLFESNKKNKITDKPSEKKLEEIKVLGKNKQVSKLLLTIMIMKV